MNTRSEKQIRHKHIRFARWNNKTIEDLLRRGKTKEQVMLRMQVPASEVERIASNML